MSLLSPRLQLKVQQKQILTPGLVQMVTVLQLNRLELKDLISQEISQNPVLEEAVDDGTEELAPEEVQALLESERDSGEPAPADQSVLDAVKDAADLADGVVPPDADAIEEAASRPVEEIPETAEPQPAADPFDEIDFGSF
ncbi:MAG: RNA polymerase sigma-54 factor, partial [Phycisphaerales bacterium]